MMLKFTNIVWDTDGEDADLPSEVILTVSPNLEEPADLLSDKFGFLVLSCTVEKYHEEIC